MLLSLPALWVLMSPALPVAAVRGINAALTDRWRWGGWLKCNEGLEDDFPFQTEVSRVYPGATEVSSVFW